MRSSPAELAESALILRWLGCAAAAFGLIWFVGLAGVSAAVPPVGAVLGPPLSLHLHLPSGLVTSLLWLAYLLGAIAVWTGFRLRRRISGTDATMGTIGVCVASLLATPQGSADHLSYLAYGRIAALGGDPYVTSPARWLTQNPHDDVIAAVQPPWGDTVSVYGPVGNALQAACGWLGGGHLHLTVWLWQMLCAVAYAAMVAALWSIVGETSKTRVLVLVAWNPVLVGPLVFGAHIDVIAMAFGIGAAWAGLRRPALAGALAAAALSVKAPYLVFGLGLLIAALPLVRSSARGRRVITLGVVAALVVLVIGHLWTGLHTYDQTRAASRFTSLSTPWRAVANLASLAGPGARDVAVSLVPVVVAVTAWAVWELTHRRPDDANSGGGASIVLRTALVVGGGWVLAAPYVLPWYDLLLWVPLVILAPRGHRALEMLVLLRTTTLALAYVPGRIVAMSPLVEDVTLAVRSYLSPAVLLASGVVLLRWAMAERRAARVP